MVDVKIIRVILVLGSFTLLNACASRSVATGNVPEEGLTVSQIYQESVRESARSWTVPRRLNQKVIFNGYTRTAANETEAMFKPLNNPAVPIFIYPHVALIGDEQLLKPGFTTEFFLYKQNQFALASELY